MRRIEIVASQVNVYRTQWIITRMAGICAHEGLESANSFLEQLGDGLGPRDSSNV